MKKKELLIITGAGQGIGEFLAKNFSENYFIVLISKSDNCKEVAKKINNKHPNSADYIKVDFEKKINFRLFENKIKPSLFSNIHLIFCAGYVDNYSEGIDISEWRKAFNINVFSHLEIFNYFLPIMKGIDNNNKIMFLAGGGSANAFDTFPAYSASKTVIVRSVENLSLRYEKYNLSIFAIAPGAIKTKMLTKVLTKTSVGTKTSKEELYAFIKYYMEYDSNKLNGRLVHIRDDKLAIEKNINQNYLKLRRIE
jgi:short-subunit dehydrogenase